MRKKELFDMPKMFLLDYVVWLISFFLSSFQNSDWNWKVMCMNKTKQKNCYILRRIGEVIAEKLSK